MKFSQNDQAAYLDKASMLEEADTLKSKVTDLSEIVKDLQNALARSESQVRDLTRPIDGTFVLSAEPTKEEISQARQVIGQLQREVRDLTGERDTERNRVDVASILLCEARQFIRDYVATWKDAHPAGVCERSTHCLVCRGRKLLERQLAGMRGA